MKHKHKAGRKVVNHMSRIMKQGHILSKQLPTQEARDAKSRANSRKSSDERRAEEV